MSRSKSKPSNKRVPTIRDVAKLAGVSIATVSRALNRTDHPVNEATKSKVLDAAKKLGFRPNAAAQTLLTRTTSTLGVLVPDISNPYYASILQGVQRVAEKAGYYTLLGNTDRDPRRQAEHLAVFAAKRVEGVCVLGGTMSESDSQIVQSLGIPVAVIGRHPVSFASVRVDNVEIGRIATEYLLKTGCTSIAFFAGPSSSTTMRDRVDGYQQALGDEGQVLWGELTPDWGSHAAQQVEVDGIVCGNDLVALGVLHGLTEKNKRVPQDVSVIGCDDIGIARNTLPPLTSVTIPSMQLGEQVVKLLLKIIENNDVPQEPVMLPVQLHVRSSTRAL